MRTSTKGILAALAALGVIGVFMTAERAQAQFGGPPPPPNTGVPLYTKMTGGDGEGSFTGVVDPPKGTFCYLMNVKALDGITAAHVHVGAAGANGGPVINLEAPAEGSSGACQPIAADLAAALLANPAGYYVNVHTRAQPAGAIRGQLKK